MATRFSNNDESDLNPGQTDYENKFNGPNDTNNDIGQLKDAEENPGHGQGTNDTGATQELWDNNVVGNSKNSPKPKGRFSFAKKKGPLAFIITILGVGGFGLATFFSPGILLIHFKEVMTNKFNAQLASADVRTTKMLITKTTSGSCGTVKILCKFKSMSDKQIDNFKKAGIEVIGEKNAFGYTKPTSFKYNDKSIPAAEFNARINNDPNFRSAVKLGYNPKFASLADSVWKKASNFLGISKKPINLSEGDDDAKLKEIQEEIKNGNNANAEVKAGDHKPGGGEYSEAEAAEANAAAREAREIAEAMTEGGTKSVAKSVLETASGRTVKGFVHMISITGPVDIACTAYTTMLNIAKAAKAVRALQLARYGMIFLNVADKIKAGKATDTEVSYLGKVLTTLTVSEDGKYKSATDSFGYKYAAFGDNGTMPTTASRFLAGGGLTGKLLGTNNKIKKTIGANPMKTCNFLSNWFVQATTFIIGGAAIILGLFPPIGIADAVKIALTAALELATAFLPALLDDIVAGVLVDSTTVGEDAGDAATSGTSGIMGTVAKFGGNAPITPTQAVKYDSIKEDIAAKYAEEDRIAHNPLDMTSTNTFMGKIASWLVPHTSKMTSSFSSFIYSMTSIITQSFSFIAPQRAYAATTNIESYEYCQDDAYGKLNLATDPYCNVTYGIPEVEDSPDPVVIAETLLNFIDPVTKENRPLINADDGKPKDQAYTKFVANCIDRTEPLVESPLGKETNYAPAGYNQPEHPGPTGRNAIDTGEPGASECMYNESSDIKTVTTSWCSDKKEPAPQPGKGLVYINASDTEVIGICERITGNVDLLKRTYYYLGNSFLYIHYIDSRVDDGMDGV